MGSDRYENRPVEIVDITDAEGLTVTVYFDQFSKLPVKQIYKRRNPEFKDFDTEVSLFGKYRDVGGGAKWPFDIRRDRNGAEDFRNVRGLGDDQQGPDGRPVHPAGEFEDVAEAEVGTRLASSRVSTRQARVPAPQGHK